MELGIRNLSSDYHEFSRIIRILPFNADDNPLWNPEDGVIHKKDLKEMDEKTDQR